MKKVALLLAAAMLALAGCASVDDTAAVSEAAPAESTAESAAAEDSTEAALPGEPHSLSAYSACAVSGSSVYTAVIHFSSSEDSLGSFDHSTVYKTDLTTGQTYEMYRTGCTGGCLRSSCRSGSGLGCDGCCGSSGNRSSACGSFLNGNAVSNTIDSNIVVLHGRILQFKIELN